MDTASKNDRQSEHEEATGCRNREEFWQKYSVLLRQLPEMIPLPVKQINVFSSLIVASCLSKIEKMPSWMTVQNKLLFSDVVVHYSKTITGFEDIIKSNMFRLRCRQIIGSGRNLFMRN